VDVCYFNIRIFLLFLNLDQIKRKLGTGGFGEVWLVYDKKDDSDKAMKKIYVGSAEVEEFKQRMKYVRSELAVGLDLSQKSENLIKLYDHFFENDYCYFVMEYCEGGDLQKIFNLKKGLPEEVFIGYFDFCYNYEGSK
jgi:serine/threonine protein kinase